MTSERERFQLLSGHFELLRDRSRPEQEAALAGIGDEALRAELAQMLALDRTGAPGIRTIVDVARVLDAPEPEPSIPTSIGGYSVLGVVGYGASGVVLRAREPETDRIVAVKVLGSGAWNPSALARFRREIRLLARLEHPAIARIYGAGTDVDVVPVRPYFAMEFVDGRPITAWARDGRDGRRRGVEEILLAVERVVAAVGYAHAMGVVHRDLKPGNVLVDADGQVKVLDFGVSGMLPESAASAAEDTRRLAPTQSIPARVRSDHLVGTIPYMSPEQFDGSNAVDARSDLYAVGVILFECLAGRLPIALERSSLAEAAQRARHEIPPFLGDVDRALRGDLEAVVARLLEKDRARRYQSAADLAADVRRYLEGRPTAARPPSIAGRLARLARPARRRAVARVAAISAAAALILALALGLAMTRSRLREAQARVAELERERARVTGQAPDRIPDRDLERDRGGSSIVAPGPRDALESGDARPRDPETVVPR